MIELELEALWQSLRVFSVVIGFFVVLLPAPSYAVETADSPFLKLAGRWTGEGMLGSKSSPPEKVKCRATYILNDAKDELKQTIRCATGGASIEVVSNLKNAGGALSGHWKETTHNYEGDLTGALTAKGLRIQIRSGDLAANMDIIVKDAKQVVEIQFINTTLVGLTLMMTKG